MLVRVDVGVVEPVRVGVGVWVPVAVRVPLRDGVLVAVRVGDRLGVGVGATPGTVRWKSFVWLFASPSVAFTWRYRLPRKVGLPVM